MSEIAKTIRKIEGIMNQPLKKYEPFLITREETGKIQKITETGYIEEKGQIWALFLFNKEEKDLKVIIEDEEVVDNLKLLVVRDGFVKGLDVLASLPRLEFLLLIHVNMVEISEEITKLGDLKFLDLSYNHIKEIPEKIINMAKLEEINVKSNFIGLVPRKMKEMKQLEKVDLRFNKIEELPFELAVKR